MRARLGLALAFLVAVLGFGLRGASASPPEARSNVRAALIHKTLKSAASNLLATSIAPPTADDVVHYVVTVGVVTTNSILNLEVSDGSTTTELAFNNGTTLTAGRLYVFNFAGAAGQTYNFQLATLTTIELLVEESRGPITAPGF